MKALTQKNICTRAFALLISLLLASAFMLPRLNLNVNAANDEIALSNQCFTINGVKVTSSTSSSAYPAIQDGDQVLFSFDYDISNSSNSTQTTFTKEIPFTNLEMSAQGTLQGSTSGTYKIFTQNGKNYFEVTVNTNTGSNIRGSIMCSGTVKASNPTDLNNNTLPIGVDTFIIDFPLSHDNASLIISKSTVGKAVSNGSKYIQTYEIILTAEGSGNITINSLTDSINNGSIASNSIKYNGQTYNDFSFLNNKTLTAGDSITIQYQAEADKSYVYSDDWSQKPLNTAKVNYTAPNGDSRIKTASKGFDCSAPWISKNGSYDQNNDKINWTVYIGWDGFTGNDSTDLGTISDTITIDEGNPSSIDLSTATVSYDQWNKIYTISYETNVSGLDNTSDHKILNEAETSVDTVNIKASATVTIEMPNPVVKELVSPRDEHGTMRWKITFTSPYDLPNGVTLTDTLSGKDHTLDEIKDINQGITYTRNDKNLKIGFTYTTGSLSKDDEVTIEYSTIADPNSDDYYTAGSYVNTVKATFAKNSDTTTTATVDKYARADYTVKSILSKSDYTTSETEWSAATIGSMLFKLTVDVSSLTNGDTVTIRDAITAGNNKDYGIRLNGIASTVGISSDKITTADTSDGWTFSFNKSDTSADTVEICYTLFIPGDKLSGYITDQETYKASNYANFYFTNTATANITSGGVTTIAGKAVKTAAPYAWSGKSQAITKGCEYNITPYYESQGDTAVYTIDVNPYGDDLAAGDTLTLTDTMGTLLTLRDDTVKVMDSNGNDLQPSLWSYVKTDNGFTLSVPDSMHLTISYEAEVLGTVDETPTDDNSSNTVKLTGFDSSSFSAATPKFSSFFRSRGTVISETGSVKVNKLDSLSQNKLTGAVFTFSPIKFNTLTGEEENLHSSDSRYTEKVLSISDITDAACTQNGLYYDIIYKMMETAAPDGYQKSNAPYYFWIPGSASAAAPYAPASIALNKLSDGSSIDFLNTPLSHVTISKQDIAGSELPGAKLTITSQTGTDLSGITAKGGAFGFTASASSVSFTSGYTPTQLSGLSAGEYILHEDAAPDGYLVASDIRFTVDSDGTVTGTNVNSGVIVMTDRTINDPVPDDGSSVKISKRDIYGKELPGAKLTITSKTGKDLSGVTASGGAYDFIASASSVSFTSGYTPTLLSGLSAGEYVLHENAAPNGYNIATDVYFTVSADGTVTGSTVVNGIVVMVDSMNIAPEPDEYSIWVDKRDISTGSSLAGASLIIRDDSGYIAAEWVTTGYPIQINNLAPGKYILSETFAPSGYLPADSISFTVTDYGTIQGASDGMIVMYDMPLQMSTTAPSKIEVIPDPEPFETESENIESGSGISASITPSNNLSAAAFISSAAVTVAAVLTYKKRRK